MSRSIAEGAILRPNFNRPRLLSDLQLPVTDQPQIEVRAVDASAVRPLRSQVLRPGQPPSALVYSHDDHPLTLHAGAFISDRLVAIATVHPEPPPDRHRGEIPEASYEPRASFRLRGMASLPEAQGRGAGRAVLERCFDHAREQSAGYLWCNARIGAVGFYERMGLTTAGAEFIMPGIGAHYVMWTEL